MPRWTWLDDLGRDLRYAVRSLARQKAFAVTAIVTLALGIGANAAIFSVVSGVILRPLPFREPDRLVQLHGSSSLVPQNDAINNFSEVRGQATSFESMVAYDVSARYLKESGESERVMVVRAEPDFFSMLGVHTLMGRTFGQGDEPTLAVIGESFWRQRLGGDPSVIGRSLTLDDQPYRVIGVMPDSFQYPYDAASLVNGVEVTGRTDLWIFFDIPLRPQSRIGSITARLKPGVTLAAVNQELAAIARRLETQYPEAYKGRSVYAEPLIDDVVGARVKQPLLMLFGAVTLVLALAAANVTNLSLARMTLRMKEVALRSALGAGRFRLVRQFLTESLLLSLAGGAAGFVLAWWGVQQLMLLVRTEIPRTHEVGLDWRVFLFLFAACAVSAAVSGLVPALFAMRADHQASLQESTTRSTMGTGQRRLRDGLVVAEVALAFVLAAAATMLFQELARLKRTDTGMSATNVLTLHLGHRMTPTSSVQRFYDIADRVAELPGVQAAGFTQMLPLQNWGWTSNSTAFTRRGSAPLSGPEFPIQMRYVTPGYFQALGIPVRGRAFAKTDTADTPRVVLINETLARRYFGSDDPVGVGMNRGIIVGVVGDVRQSGLDSPVAPELYFPMAQNWSQLSELGMSLVVRADRSPESLTAPIRAVIRDVDPAFAIFTVKTMERVVADSLSNFTTFLWLMTSFAGLALLLAITGTYGVISYVASSRVREFAIRVALGADRRRVTVLVLGQGLVLTGLGVAFGLAGTVAAAPLLATLPIPVNPPGLLTLVPVAAFIAAVALAACLIPARRAAGVNPMSMLRND